jgi:hypothetical protein
VKHPSKEKQEKKKQNMFDTILMSSTKSPEAQDEIDRYLSTDTENVQDVLLWWSERRAMFPCLSRMALDYLTIPGASFFRNNLT